MIGQLYVGYFGRAADPDGLNYWITQLDAGMSIQAIANSFAVQPEATALYSYLAAPEVGDPAAFVTAIYQDLFNRGPDAAGLAYWVNQLTVQGTPPGQMVLNIISGAQGTDKTTVENKTHIAVDYAQKFVDNNLTWIGIDNIQGARDVVTPVTFDPATVVAAELQIDGIITQELTNPANIQLSPNLTTILSGGTVAVTLKADPSQANKDFQYTITGIDSTVVKGGALSGTVKLGTDSTAVINIETVVTAAQLNTANETIKVTVGPISTNVALTEGTQVVTQTGPVNEGNSFSFTVTTSGIAPGSANGLVQTYTITGPGLAHIPVAERSGTVTLDNNGSATVTVDTLATLPDTGTTSVTITVGNDAPVDVVINETAVQDVTPNVGTIAEGGSLIFTITTSGVAGSAVTGQVENWTLTGPAAAEIDGPLSGTVTLDQDGTATVTVHTKVVELNDGALKNLVFTLLSGAVPTATATVGVTQGTQVTSAPSSVDEGNAFTFEVTTSGVAAGSVAGRIESYTITGAGVDHIPAAERTGQVTLDANGHASVTVHTLADLDPLGTDPITITVGNNAPIVVNIQDTAFQTVTVSPASADIIQGQSLTFTINTFGVPAGALAGTVQSWTLIGTGTNQVTGGVLSGTVTLDANNSAVVTVGTDFSIINGPLTQNLTFRLNSGGTNVDSPTVTIHESTLTVTPPALPVEEGQQVTFTITGVNIPNGTTYTYTLSGDALGNVVPTSQIHGTVTINNNSATVVVNTISNDDSGLTKGLTLTIDQVPTATGTAQIEETAPITFILTTGTDNFTGNPAGGNTFFAVANSNIFTSSSTLGQNDKLEGGGGPDNVLTLQTTGLFPQLINAFNTNGIQTFLINPGQAGGTTVDMSSVFGMTKVVNSNASGDLVLLNLTQKADAELVNPSDIFGGTVDFAMQYQNNPGKPSEQNLLLDPTVSPITGLANSRFWVNVDKVTITSSGPGTNGLITVNGATGPFAATALTNVTMLGSTNFVAGTSGSGQTALAFTGAGASSSTNVLDLSFFTGLFFDVGDPGTFPAITAVGGLKINSGPGGMNGIYTPAAGFTGATQVGGVVNVGGNLALNIHVGNVSNQAMTVVGNVEVKGVPFFADGGLLNSSMTTTGLGSVQSYQGFNGGLTGSITTNNGAVGIGEVDRVNGVINEKISTGTGQAVIVGGNGNATLDFSGAGTTGFHKALNGPNTEDRFIGGTATNTLIIDPSITNVNGFLSNNGTGLATGVQIITLASGANTAWFGSPEGGTGGVLPTDTVDLGLLNQNSTFTGINTGFAQTININVRLIGKPSPVGQTFKDAVSGDTFVLDNGVTVKAGGSMQDQVMAFDFALPTANNTLNFTANNVNAQGGIPRLTLRDFEINSAAANQQNPITTANLQMNRTAGAQANIFTTLDNLNRLTTLNLSGTANRFDDDPFVRWAIEADGGAGTLTTITGGDQNYALMELMIVYQSTVGGTITLGNGANTMGAVFGNWTITSGKVPGGGTAGDSGDNVVLLNPQLGNLHTVKTGGGADEFQIGLFQGPGGGRVDIMSGAGNDLFSWNQAGIFPALNSAQKVDAGDGRDTFELVGGAINENDSLFGQITNTEILKMADGLFNNSLLLNFFADGSGLDTIITRGKGSSNVFFEGTGFDNPMRYEIASQFAGGGDSGHDAIIVAALPVGSNAITVATTTGGFNIAFETGLMTSAINPGTGLITKSGIFANPNAGNTLELTADGTTANVFALGGFGTHNVQTILGKTGGAASQTVWLVSDPALGTGVTTVDLSPVQGPTIVYANGSTLRETITGGLAFDTLFGGLAADTITAKGTIPGFGTNFIWGGGDFTGGAQDVLTGVAGGAGNNVGTVFYLNSVADSPGGPFDPTFNDKDVYVTNFHKATDTVLINPTALVLGDVPVFLGDATNYGNALALLAGGGALQTQAVYQLDQKVLWVDADNNGLLNQLDIRVFVDFGSHGFNAGSFNFGNLLGLFTGAQVTNYINGILNPASNVTFSGTLLPGEFLFGGGPGNNDKLTLANGDVADGILVGFEHLEIAAASFGTLSINQWNSFWPQITGPGTNTAKFRDGIDAIKGSAMTTVVAIENYDFSALTYGITMTTQGFDTFFGPFHGPGTVIGTNFNDTFNTSEFDLKGQLQIDGLNGNDTLNVDAVLTFGNAFGQVGPAGTTNAVVLNVETLNLLDPAVFPFVNPANVVGFNAGTQFNVVNGTDFADVIIDPEFLAGAWTLNLAGGSGPSVAFGQNIIRINNTSANLSPGTITAVGGQVALQINVAGSNTTMTFAQYTLFQASFSGIFLTDGANFGNTTITFSDQVTGGAVLDPDVGVWVFSSADDSFTLGALGQSINVASGGADTAFLNIAGNYTGTFTGGGEGDTIVFQANANIVGINGGAATTFQEVSFNNQNLSVTMTNAQYNGFDKPFEDTGDTQTITITDTANAQGDVGIENYFLQSSGNDSFRVTPDNINLVGGSQNVIFQNGGNDAVFFGTGTFTGNVNGFTKGGGDTVLLDGDADVSGVNSGGAFNANTLNFLNHIVSVTMTTVQHEDFDKPFLATGNTQTITLTTGGTATGDAGIENYVLIGGASNGHTFTVAPDSVGLVGLKQNVAVTAAGAVDTIRFGNSVIFSGNLTGLSTADPDVVQFFGGGANISGVGGGLATGAKFANFSDANQFVIMTLAQHNGFTQPFQQTLLTQQITLVDSGVATGDAGIEQYNLANGNDTFTVAKDNGAFKQNINVASGGDDTLVFDTGTFSGTYTGDSFNDTIKFVGNADISGAVGLGPIGNVDFSNANVSVTVNFLNQYQFFTQPFLNTANVQTITFSVGLTLPTGDVGIENYVFSTADDQFIVAADNNQLVGGAQNTDFSSGGNDLIAYYTGKYSGNVVGMGAGDRVVFANGVMDISGVNGGAATGATFVLFNLSAIAATMTMAQYNGFTQPFSLTSGSTQTVILTTSGVATGDAGIENYKLASGDDTFTVAKDNIGLIDGKQNVDIGSGGNDVIHYGAGTFTGNLVGGGVGDTVQFDGDVTDVSGVNGGAVMGPKTVSFSNTAVDVSMTLVQHNDFTKPFGSTTGTQTITFTTNGTATGDIGIEQYILGQDGKGPNFFTVGIIGQSVTGRNDNDTVINPFGGVSGVLLGGSNTPTGDTLILQGANTTLAAGSGQFENLTLTVNNGTVTSNTFAHNGFTGVIDAPGTNNTYTVNDNLGGVLTGLSGFENYTFASNGGGFDFTLTDAQTGTITGSTRNDIFRATAGQIAEAILIDAGSAPFEILHINTDAAGLDLAAKTAGFDRFFLNAGSTANVFGVNSSNVLYAATGSTIFTMGSVGANQTYNGGTGANAGIDNVTFNVGSTSVFTNEGNDIVTSLVGGALTGTLNGGADFDKLSLTNNDDLTGATVTSFEDLLLANNASVKMTGTQYNQFTTNSQALGTNAVTVVTAGGGILGSRDLFAGIENWTLLDGLQSVYTITGDGQSVTDQRSGNVANQATIDGGLTGVTLLANGGAGYVVIDASGGTNHSITLVGGGGNADSVIFGGVHTGIALDAGLENDFIQVQTAGNISGTLNGGGGTSDSLNLFDAADISGSTVSGFENLLLVSNAAAKMSGATWDQFVGTNGTATAGHSVEGLGDEAVTLSSTTNNVTTAYTDTDRIENYVLSSNANDFFRVNNTSTAPADQVEVNLSGGGTDFIVLNDGSGAALNSQDVRTTLVNFASGVGGDVVQVQLNGASISSGGAVVTAAVDQNIAAATTTVVYNSNLALMDGTWSAVEARAALDAALGAGTVADEQLLTMTVYNTDGGAYVMAVQVKDADTFSTANMDLIGVLNTVGVNTLVTTNFT